MDLYLVASAKALFAIDDGPLVTSKDAAIPKRKTFLNEIPLAFTKDLQNIIIYF